ncbi:MAG: peptidase prolyl oligopeptidase active site domain protein [Gemmatimonadetes bacterium]|nr:peptidase prolyl oligopeptidase active site domain protein [Gemmatimonadota bacterium]
MRMSRTLTLTSLLALVAAPLVAQQKPATTPADWAKWETLGSGALSPDGRWVAYDFRRTTGPGELRYRTVASEAEQTVRNGTGPTFSSNSHWLLYTIMPDTAGAAGRAGRGGGRGAGAPGAAAAGTAIPRNRIGIVDLRTGTTTVLEDIQSFVASKDGAHVAMRRYPATGRTSRGADLVVRDLEQGSDITLGNVAEYSWSDDGSVLAMTIDVDGKTGNGVQLLNSATGTIRSLDAGDAQYANLQWRARSNDLAVFRSKADSMFADTSFTVLAWRNAATPNATKLTYDFTADTSFPTGARVASYRRPQWSDDGSTLFFGIAPREPKPATAARGGATGTGPARVEIWHWKDLREYHQQDRQAAQDRTRTHLVAWHLSPSKLVRLADDALETIQLSENRTIGLASDETPYFKESISGRPVRDVYVVNVATGAREKILTKTAFAPTMSPDARYLVYSQGGQWWSYDLASKARANLTAGTRTTWVNMEDDHPVPERRPYGVAGWTKGEQSVLLYDRFDVWQVNIDGTKPVRLTRGKEDSTVYRIARETAGGGRGGRGGGAADVDIEDRWIDPAKPVMLSATGEYTKKSGYARMTLGQPAQRVLFVDKAVSNLEKAKNADVYLFEQQSYQDSPDFFVSSAALGDGRQVSHTNAFQSDYAWGRQVLLPYTNTRGEKLQMMLTYPANYDPSRKYPMVVYYYEKLSQGMHQYIVPSERATYNTTVFSQNGYFVLRPDVVFQPRDAGFSGLDCVTSAVKTVLATGMIDPKKVGNFGHSWGGYQSAFYAVHNPGIFAASIAGAPLTDLVSFYGYTSFNTGSPETGHFETGQERMEVSLWEDPQAYIRNSTVFAVDKLKIPLLLEEGDSDGNVNYWQSTELYNFGRRLGKEVVYLIYNDENHGVARPESQADYARRQLEWFGHYLKGEPAPDWITNGESYLTRQKLLKEGAQPVRSALP